MAEKRRIRGAMCVALVATTMVVSRAAPVDAAGMTVTTANDVTANDGLCSLREAIVAANDDTPSGAAAGECPAGGSDDVITLGSGVTYAVAPRLPTLSSGTITVDGNGSTIASSATLRVIEVAADADATINDVTLTHLFSTSGVTGRGFYNRPGGTATLNGVTVEDNSEVGHGGGIWNGGDLAVTDSVVTRNSNVPNTTRLGGGVYNATNATLTLTSSTISANTADVEGGGLYHQGGTGAVTLVNSAVTGNTSTNGNGGGISNLGTLNLAGSTISGNTAGSTAHRSGGGIHADNGGFVRITNSIVSDNEAHSGGGVYNVGALALTGADVTGNRAVGGHGGGLHDSGTTEITRTRFHDNEAVDGGGIYTTLGSNVGVVDTEFVANRASNNGGAIRASDIELVRSTLADNSAMGDGGGLFVGPNGFVANSTFTGNNADGAGGGIYSGVGVEVRFTTITNNQAPVGAGVASSGADFGSTRVTASIIAGNAGSGHDVEVDVQFVGGAIDTFISGGYNVLGSVDAFATAFDKPGDTDGEDPRLAPLANNGGTTLTHALLPGSPAIDLVPTNIDGADGTDQRGVDRSPPGAKASAGSYECDCQPAIISMHPTRIADSRDEPTVDGEFRNTGGREGGTVWEIDVVGRGTPSGVELVAVVVNVTAVNAVAPGFATVFSCSENVPHASSLNYGPGDVEPNELIVGLSKTGSICVYTLTMADIIVDFVGFVPSGSPYQAVEPTRFADSRAFDTFDGSFRDTGIRKGDTTWEVDVAGRGPVPTNADAVAVNITVTGGAGPGFATVFPCTAKRPNASSLNYDVDITRPNEIIAKLSPDGTLCIYTLTDVDVIVDVVGFLPETPAYTSVEPVRFADSRDSPTFDGSFRNTGRREADTVWEVQIGSRGVVPVGAQSVVINLTVTEAAAPGFVTVYACGPAPRPATSAVNYFFGTTRPNELIVGVGVEGRICVYTKTPTHVIIDVVGFIDTPAFFPS